MSMMRKIVIDLSAIRDNVSVLKKLAKSPLFMAVVKADGYGHGLIQVARACRQGGADWLGTALLEESITLRENGDVGPLLCWLGYPCDQWKKCIELNIDIATTSVEHLNNIIEGAKLCNKIARIHIKVDTGLGRNGIMPNDLPALVDLLLEAKSNNLVDIIGIFQHFAIADSPSSPTIQKQIDVFKNVIIYLESRGLNNLIKHAANSAAVLTSSHAHFDMVRPGIAIYGISPGGEVGPPEQYNLRPAMSLRCQIALIKNVPYGHGISYGGDYVTSKDTRIALIPLGYADGIPRKAGALGPIIINGKKFLVAGRVCMDQFVVDIGDHEVIMGDEAILFGDPAKGEPEVEEWARAAETIGYEIVTRLGQRVPKVYINEEI